MASIFSSKLYRASTRKKAIQAALNSPLNRELVQQLVDNLDDEYLSEEYLGKPKSSDGEYEEKDTKIRPSEGSPSGPQGGGSGGSFDFDEPFEDTESFDDSSSDDSESSEVPEDSEVSESEDVKDAEITAVESIEDIDLDSLRGLLNSRSDTEGVVRVTQKSDEIWIVYNDSVNLNTVMESVISVLAGSGYSDLSFNRLARTENSIVFTYQISSPGVESQEDE